MAAAKAHTAYIDNPYVRRSRCVNLTVFSTLVATHALNQVVQIVIYISRYQRMCVCDAHSHEGHGGQ